MGRGATQGQHHVTTLSRSGRKGRGRRGREQGRNGYLSQELGVSKALSLNREETDVALRQMVVYKGKTHVRVTCLISIGNVN